MAIKIPKCPKKLKIFQNCNVSINLQLGLLADTILFLRYYSHYQHEFQAIMTFFLCSTLFYLSLYGHIYPLQDREVQRVDQSIGLFILSKKGQWKKSEREVTLGRQEEIKTLGCSLGSMAASLTLPSHYPFGLRMNYPNISPKVPRASPNSVFLSLVCCCCFPHFSRFSQMSIIMTLKTLSVQSTVNFLNSPLNFFVILQFQLMNFTEILIQSTSDLRILLRQTKNYS